MIIKIIKKRNIPWPQIFPGSSDGFDCVSQSIDQDEPALDSILESRPFINVSIGVKNEFLLGSTAIF
jgi:hypothetical protein